jgi:16S rRNA A1518/A1519 N6-dimethyltransferase RsmA/KsgA/DIM1 with predicted DNA glycosylase/AP lyase activity
MAEIDPEGAEIRALDAIVDLTDRTILEIGAGDGRLTWRLAARARSVLALEPREQDVARARQTMPSELRDRVRFVATDATTYGYPRARFDLAVLSWSL